MKLREDEVIIINILRKILKIFNYIWYHFFNIWRNNKIISNISLIKYYHIILILSKEENLKDFLINNLKMNLRIFSSLILVKKKNLELEQNISRGDIFTILKFQKISIDSKFTDNFPNRIEFSRKQNRVKIKSQGKIRKIEESEGKEKKSRRRKIKIMFLKGTKNSERKNTKDDLLI